MSYNIGCDRRRFLGAALAAFGVRELVAITPESLGTLKQVAAGVLSVGSRKLARRTVAPSFFFTAGPTTFIASSMWFRSWRPPLPGDRPLLARLRYDQVVSSDSLRNGQQAALALDVIALMDALGIDRAVVAGPLGRTDGKHHGGALAGALQGNSRTILRQSGSRRSLVNVDGTDRRRHDGIV